MNATFATIISLIGFLASHAGQSKTVPGIPGVTQKPNYKIATHLMVSERGAVQTLVPHPKNPKLIFVNSSDSSIRLRNLCTNQVLWEFRRPGLDTYISYMTVSPDGKYVVTNDPLARIFVVNGNNGQLLSKYRFQNIGATLLPRAAAFDASSQKLYAEYDGDVFVFKAPQFAAPIQTYQSNVPNDTESMAVRRNGDVILLSQQHGFVRWSADNEDKPVLDQDLSVGQPFSFSKSVTLLDRWILAPVEPNIHLVTLDQGEVVQSFIGHRQSHVVGSSATKDGRMLFTVAYDRTLKIWETKTGKILQDLITVDSQNAPKFADDVAVSQTSDKLLFVGLHSGEIAIYDQDQAYKKLCPNR